MTDNFIIFMILASISFVAFIWNGIKIESGCHSISDKIKKQEDFAKELSDVVWGIIIIIGIFILLSALVLKLF